MHRMFYPIWYLLSWVEKNSVKFLIAIVFTAALGEFLKDFVYQGLLKFYNPHGLEIDIFNFYPEVPIIYFLLVYLIPFPFAYFFVSCVWDGIANNKRFLRRKIKTIFYASSFLMTAFMSVLLIYGYVNIFEVGAVLSLGLSFFIAFTSFLNPFWIYSNLGKRKMKRLVISSFFLMIIFLVLGFFINQYFFIFFFPFFTIFLIQFMIDSIYYYQTSAGYSSERLRLLSVLMQYFFFRYLIILAVFLVRIIIKILRRR